WGGGHSNWALVDGYDCSGFVSAVLHAAGYLTTPVTTQTLPGQPGIASGPGRGVTIFDRADAASASEDHVIIDINGQWWESGARAPPAFTGSPGCRRRTCSHSTSSCPRADFEPART